MPFRTIDLLDMPPDKLVPSADGRMCVGWYICFHEEDRYRELTMYHISVWDLDTGNLVKRFVRSSEWDHETSTGTGADAVAAEFAPSGRELIIRTREQGQYAPVVEEREPLPV